MLIAALMLFLTAAVQAAGLFAVRARTRLLNGRTGGRLDWVHQYAHDRERIVAALVLSRTVWLTAGNASAVAVAVDHASLSWRPLLLAVACTCIAAGVIEGAARVVISHNPDRWSHDMKSLATAFRAAFYAPAYLLDLPGRALLHMPALRPRPQEQEEGEELIRLVEMEEQEGGIEDDERKMIKAVFELEGTAVRELMVPRMDITAVDSSASLEEVAEVIAVRGFSRIPVYDGNIDTVVGVIYAKDILVQLARSGQTGSIRELARQPLFIPESKPVDELLRELRSRRIHIAIVVDEYGGTAGLVTIEDLVEEIVGEIEDEHDHSEPGVVRTGADEAVVDAGESVDILKEIFDVEVDADDFDTVGGFVLHHLGRVPAVNDTLEVNGLRLRMLAVTGRRLRKISVTRLVPASDIASNYSGNQRS